MSAARTVVLGGNRGGKSARVQAALASILAVAGAGLVPPAPLVEVGGGQPSARTGALGAWSTGTAEIGPAAFGAHEFNPGWADRRDGRDRAPAWPDAEGFRDVGRVSQAGAQEPTESGCSALTA